MKPTWINVISVDQLNEILNSTQNQYSLFFKHSTRCSISSMALKFFESDWDNTIDNVQCYFIDLISYREVSNALADLSKIVHQSPQVILMRNGEVNYHASHESIDTSKILNIIKHV